MELTDVEDSVPMIQNIVPLVQDSGAIAETDHTQFINKVTSLQADGCSKSNDCDNKVEPMNRFDTFRSCPTFITCLVFYVSFTDGILHTVFIVSLPIMLSKYEGYVNESRLSNFTVETEGTIDKSVLSGLLIGMMPILSLLFTIIMASFPFLFGRKYPLLLGSSLMIGATLMFLFATRWWLLLIGRVLEAAAMSVDYVCCLSLLADQTTNKKRPLVFAIVTSGGGLGAAIGIVIGSFASQWINYKTPFWMELGVIVVEFACILLFLEIRVGLKLNKYNKSISVFVHEARMILRNRHILVACGVTVLIQCGTGIYHSVGVGWLLGTLSLQQWQVGTILATGFIIHTISVPIVGKILSKYGGHWVVNVVAMLLYVIAFLLFTFFGKSWLFLITDILIRVAQAHERASVPAIVIGVTDLELTSNYEAAAGVVYMAIQIGAGLGSIISGVLATYIGIRYVCIAFGIICFGYAFGPISMRKLDIRSAKPSVTKSIDV